MVETVRVSKKNIKVEFVIKIKIPKSKKFVTLNKFPFCKIHTFPIYRKGEILERVEINHMDIEVAIWKKCLKELGKLVKE